MPPRATAEIDPPAHVRQKFVPRLFPVGVFDAERIDLKTPRLQTFPRVGETGFEPATARPPAGADGRGRVDVSR
jgi:hypothetical protein